MDALLHAFGIDWRLLIAQAVNFGILFVALWLLLYKPVMKTLDERAKKIAQGVHDAERAAEKLAGADTEAAEIVAGADSKASEVVASARETANAEKTRIVKEAEARAESIARDADARAKEAAAKALRDSEKEIARLAVLAAAKVVGEKK
ncbi:F0F1 ATP synthase subunit B [Patescibacteria group bacterium]|nr:F0F1 ATP synthase subunit B [Patescibacteria group bacterium]